MATGGIPDSSEASLYGERPPPYKQTQEDRSRVTVYCGNSRKGIVADKTNFDKLHNTIANRFKLTGDFQLQAEDNDGKRVDLDCDEDLEDNSEFVHTIWVIETPATAPKTKVVVHHGNTTKQLHVEDKTSFEKLHNAIVRRFQLEGDYTYQIENEDGKRFDIDNDADLKENSEFLGNIWAIPNPEAAIKCAQERETRESVTLKHGRETFTYSLIEPLDTKSAIVVTEYKVMQEKVGIAALSSSLEIVGDCLEIAYYATTDDHSMQKYVQNMQFGVAQLCRECNTTMVGMQTKAEDAVSEMQCGFGYLLEGFEDFGIKRLGSVAEIAGKIHKDTQCLNTALESTISLAVRKGIDEVSRKLADGEGDGAIEMREDELNEEILDMIRKQNETREELEQAKSKIAVLSLQEDEAVQAETEYLNADTGFGFGIKKMFTLGFYQGSTQLAEQQKRLTREAKEDQEKDRERLKELRTAGAEANRALAKTAAMLAQLKANPNEMTSVAIRGAKAGLKGLGTILLNIKAFWADCQKAFQSIGQTKAIDQLKTFPKGCLEERKKYWQSKGFKTEAFNSIVKLVAIQQMCIDFQRTLRQVLENIDRCIRDNPSREQAMKKIPKLVDNFDRKTEQKQPETTALVH